MASGAVRVRPSCRIVPSRGLPHRFCWWPRGNSPVEEHLQRCYKKLAGAFADQRSIQRPSAQKRSDDHLARHGTPQHQNRVKSARTITATLRKPRLPAAWKDHAGMGGLPVAHRVPYVHCASVHTSNEVCSRLILEGMIPICGFRSEGTCNLG